MKTLIILLPLLAIALARPQHGGEGDAQILSSEFDNIGIDGYHFGFETSNGISRKEEGKIANLGSENEANQVQGTYSYTDASGKKVVVNFVADENGYRPKTSLARK